MKNRDKINLEALVTPGRKETEFRDPEYRGRKINFPYRESHIGKKYLSRDFSP